jgi:hypothetical protein
MLTLLAIACKQKFVLDSYEDEAVGHLEKNADGKLAITRVNYAQRSRGAATESPVRKSSIRCIMPPMRIASLPTRLKPR